MGRPSDSKSEITEFKMAFSGDWKKVSVTGAEDFLMAFDPKPENVEKLKKSAMANMVTHMKDNGSSITFSRTLTLDGASKSTSENTIVFGQESDYTGPLGNTMKVNATRNGDTITASASGVEIKLELVGGKAVETFSGKGKTWTRTSEKC